MRAAIALLVGLAACGSSSGDAPQAPQNQVPPTSSPDRCEADDDCVLSYLASEHDCCENACEPAFAYTEAQLAATREAAQTHCADKVEECAKRDCPTERDLYPACVDHACVALER